MSYSTFKLIYIELSSLLSTDWNKSKFASPYQLHYFFRYPLSQELLRKYKHCMVYRFGSVITSRSISLNQNYIQESTYCSFNWHDNVILPFLSSGLIVEGIGFNGDGISGHFSIRFLASLLNWICGSLTLKSKYVNSHFFVLWIQDSWVFIVAITAVNNGIECVTPSCIFRTW